MRIITAATAVATSVTIASFAALPTHAVTTCTASTVTGSYGQFPIIAPQQQSEGTSLLTFDGSRRVEGHETDVGSDLFEKTHIKGYYVVLPDCGIKMTLTYYNTNGTLNRKTAFEGVIVNSGAKIDTIVVPLAGHSAYAAPYVLEAVQ